MHNVELAFSYVSKRGEKEERSADINYCLCSEISYNFDEYEAVDLFTDRTVEAKEACAIAEKVQHHTTRFPFYLLTIF